MNIPNVRVFEITMLHTTNTKGERVKIYDARFNKTKIIPYSYNYNSCKDEGIDYLNSIGINVLFAGENKKGFILLTDNFEVQIK